MDTAMMTPHLQQLLPPSLLQEGQPLLLQLLHLLQEALLLHLRLPLPPTLLLPQHPPPPLVMERLQLLLPLLQANLLQPLLLQHLVRQSNNSHRQI